MKSKYFRLCIGVIGLACLFIYAIKNKETHSHGSQLTGSPHIPCTNHSHCVTLVTSYFPLKKSKQSENEFEILMTGNFITHISSPLVIFTTHEMAPLIQKFQEVRNAESKLTITYAFQDVWAFPWIKKRRGLKREYSRQHDKLDPEKEINNPDLYAVWNSKPWMLAHVAKTNPFNSTFFYWVDFGRVIDNQNNLTKSLDVKRAIQVFGSDDISPNFRKLQVFAIQPFKGYKRNPESPSDFDSIVKSLLVFIQPRFFGGTLYGVMWFSDTFYYEHDHLIGGNHFVGKEENLMNWVALRYPEQMLVLCPCEEPNYDKCGDTESYFQYWCKADSNSCRRAPLKNMTLA